jgi:uncharacterized MAPEG superfamily protein
MTPELLYLVWSAALTLLLAVIGVSGATLQVGLPTLAGNREGLPEMTGWAGRAQRAHRNMLESLVLFAILVLAAKAVGISNAMTLLGRTAVLLGSRGARRALHRRHPVGADGGVGRVGGRADPDLLAAGGLEGSVSGVGWVERQR